jgi:hypothetical protein
VITRGYSTQCAAISTLQILEKLTKNGQTPFGRAANIMPSLGNDRNFPMHTAGKAAANGPFPTNADGEWRHSDFKDVGLPYVYPMYQAMIDRGGLNQ